MFKFESFQGFGIFYQSVEHFEKQHNISFADRPTLAPLLIKLEPHFRGVHVTTGAAQVERKENGLSLTLQDDNFLKIERNFNKGIYEQNYGKTLLQALGLTVLYESFQSLICELESASRKSPKETKKVEMQTKIEKP